MSKRRKFNEDIAIKSDINNGEVLVLPPKLLQKLGISLGNIYTNRTNNENLQESSQSSCEYSSYMEGSDCEDIQEKHGNEDPCTSIMETANLMKDSVFLSPSFSANVNMNECEVSNLNPTTMVVSTIKTIETLVGENIIDIPSIESKQKNEINNDLIESNSNDKKLNNNKITIERNDTHKTKTDTNKMSQKCINKINLISEEIIGPDEIKELKKIKSENLLPVSVHSVVSVDKSQVVETNNEMDGKSSENDLQNEIISKKCDMKKANNDFKSPSNLFNDFETNSVAIFINEVTSGNTQNEIAISDTEMPQKSVQTNDFTINGHVSYEDKSPNMHLYNEDVCTNMNYEKTEYVNKPENTTCIQPEFNSSNNSNNSIESNKNNIIINKPYLPCDKNDNHKIDLITQNHEFQSDLIDKAGEIVGYLNEILQVSKSPLIIKRNLMKSKSFIQGVEKPGGHTFDLGSFKKEKAIKTYSRVTKAQKKYINKVVNTEMVYDSVADINENKRYNDEINLPKFCVCYDFGKYNQYNSDDSLIHLHFSNQNNIGCAAEVFFSIYNETDYINYFNTIDEHIIDSAQTDTGEHSICFNELNEYNDNNDDSVGHGLSISLSFVENDSKITSVKSIEISNTCIKSENQIEVTNEQCKVDIIQELEKENSKQISGDGIVNCKETTQKVTECDAVLTEDSATRMARKRKQSSDSTDSDDNALISLKSTSASTGKDELDNSCTQRVKCGVCKKEVSEWLTHIGEVHNYIAWEDGKTKIDVKDSIAVRKHLSDVSKSIGGLTCVKCGCVRKYGKAYLEHVKSCDGSMNISLNSTLNSSYDTSVCDYEAKVKCAICDKEVYASRWINHIQKEHNYMAWEYGCTPMDITDTNVVLKHLEDISKRDNGLVCSNCRTRYLKAQMYLDHREICAATTSNEKCVELETPKRKQRKLYNDLDEADVQCGVCDETVKIEDWNRHIQHSHQYLAWKKGEDPLDLTDEDVVNKHLNSIRKIHNGFYCHKCNIRRKYVKSYLEHIQTCEETPNSTVNIDCNVNNNLVCGVCKESVLSKEWYKHIEQEHSYMAWKDGQTPLDSSDPDAVFNHLTQLLKKVDGLICAYCKCRRRHAKSYIDHIEQCKVSSHNNSSDAQSNETSSIICGVCGKEISDEKWFKHIENEHKYLAWREGETPLDTNNPDDVYDHLYALSKNMDGLKCLNCGCRRKYVKSYLDHIQRCGQPGESPNNSVNIGDNLNDSNSTKEDTNMICENSEIICGVCKESVSSREWYNHIEKEHNYMAWKDGDKPLDSNDPDAVFRHFSQIIKKVDGLICPVCKCRRKYVKSYIDHIKHCTVSTNKYVVNDTQCNDTFPVNCGVCGKEICSSEIWIKHIESEHKYLAWKEGETPLDVNNSDVVYDHLYALSKNMDGLTCSNCGCRRKYVKSYLDHIQSCGHLDDSISVLPNLLDQNVSAEVLEQEMVKCGVCGQEMKYSKWFTHLHTGHSYLAWKEGEPPLDVNDSKEVKLHLTRILKQFERLLCPKCNVKKKFVSTYLEHVEYCNVGDNCDNDEASLNAQEQYECALCGNKGLSKDWKHHALYTHYNVAWRVGQQPINVKNSCAVEKYLKEYRTVSNPLECLNCGITRASVGGFFAHVITCGKTDEEVEMYKSTCEYCDQKYLGVYKYQHMAMHRQQEYAKAQKEKLEERAKSMDVTPTSGKRLAAERAKTVIESLKSEKCPKCDQVVENTDDLKTHDCNVDYEANDSDKSVDSELSSEEDSEDSDIDSALSDQEQADMQKKKKKKKHHQAHMRVNTQRIPFHINDPLAYVERGAKDFQTTHFTSDTLFPQWLKCDYEEVSADNLCNYMPALKESCKIMLNEWTTYKLFEARVEKGLSLFVGACIQNVCWAPSYSDTEICKQYLAVNCHRGTDIPRVDVSELREHPNMIQIWEFENMNESAEFVFGIAHDFGTVWNMEWCPSGGRETLPVDEENGFKRLGLLAVVCSNGSAYIFSVPYPCTVIKNKNNVFKLKPVAELRLYKDNEQRCQATALNWSNGKGHNCIMVGYSNGMTAFYNLEDGSPLLKSVENEVDVFYPYHDTRPHTACVTAVSTYPRMVGADCDAGSVCSSSSTGVSASLGGSAAHAAAARLLTAAASLAYVPQWPAPLLAGNNELIHQAVNELDWWGIGRRLGSMSTMAGCNTCSRLAVANFSLVKTLNVHPVHNNSDDLKTIAKIQAIPFEKPGKTSGSNLELNTYDKFVKMYGIGFKFSSQISKAEMEQVPNKNSVRGPELFPLGDITSMAYCCSAKHHKKLAVAIHAGFIFIINA